MYVEDELILFLNALEVISVSRDDKWLGIQYYCLYLLMIYCIKSNLILFV